MLRLVLPEGRGAVEGVEVVLEEPFLRELGSGPCARLHLRHPHHHHPGLLGTVDLAGDELERRVVIARAALVRT